MLDSLYQRIDGQTDDLTDGRLVIGISCNRKDGVSCVAEPYFQAVVMAGGAPVLIPVTTDTKALERVVGMLDGIIFSGGGDFSAEYLGEEAIPELGETDVYRDEYDFLLLKLAFDRQLPIFGICRGHQLINLAFGGTLYQDINAQFPGTTLKHSQDEARDVATHDVTLLPTGTKLQYIVCGKAKSGGRRNLLAVNSFHHQAVRMMASSFMATAVAPDEVNEAMEHPEYSIFSVQWHPEPMAVAGNQTMLNLFRYHVRQAALFAKAKALHHRIITIDSHVDTPTVSKSFDLGRRGGDKVNLPLMEMGLLDAVYMVAYQPQGERDKESMKKVFKDTMACLSMIREQAKRYPERLGIAVTPDDLWRLKHEGKKALLLGVENGYAIGKSLSNLQRLKEVGVSYMTLCHNGDNDICDSAVGKMEWGGLSAFGRKVVKEMNRIGLMIDVSHASDQTFYDVLKYTQKPVIASHSSVRALCHQARNLDDDQIRALAAQGGVIQVCLYKRFINLDEDKASLSDAMKHICHVIDIAGIDAVGIGSDFDGGGELIGCRAANELIQITMRLIAEGLNDASIAKIWGGNLMRVMQTVQNVASH